MLAGMVALAGLVLGIAWLTMHWGAISATGAGWAVSAAPWLLWVVISAGVLALLGGFAALVWRARWRWAGWRPTDLVPMRYRRY